jgi:hypothetical protein
MMRYANDTIYYLEDDLVKARNLKMLLYLFEKMSGLKTNFEKSDVLTIGDNNTVVTLSVFSAPTNYGVIKITCFSFNVVLRTIKHTMIYPILGLFLEVIALRPVISY